MLTRSDYLIIGFVVAACAFSLIAAPDTQLLLLYLFIGLALAAFIAAAVWLFYPMNTFKDSDHG